VWANARLNLSIASVLTGSDPTMSTCLAQIDIIAGRRPAQLCGLYS